MIYTEKKLANIVKNITFLVKQDRSLGILKPSVCVTDNWDEFHEILPNLKHKGLKNPFTEPTFQILTCEAYSAASYSCCGVSISFDDVNRCLSYSFDSENLILGCYVVFLQNAGFFSVDSGLRVWNNKRFIEHEEDCIKHYFELLNLASELNYQTYIIAYSKTAEGIESYKYNKEIIIYPVDKWHEDDYYLNKELNSR